MLGPSPDGTHAHMDYFGTGMQLSLEHQIPVYDTANALRFGVATLQSLALSQVTGDVQLRILFLELRLHFGYRAVWRNMAFEPAPAGSGEYCLDCDSAARREQDPLFGRGPGTDSFSFAEPRLQLYFPLNEYFVATSYFAPRWEGGKDLSYDWFYCNIHDGGWNYRWELLTFLKHRDWGGIGPYVQLMWLPRNGHYDLEAAGGFNATMRLGLLRENDLLFLTFLVRPNDAYYGQHAYYLPMRALLIYRVTLDL
jgi:hypothetical protein